MAAGGLVCIPRNFATATPQTGRRSRGVPLSLMGALAPVAPRWLRPWVDIVALCIMCWSVMPVVGLWTCVLRGGGCSEPHCLWCGNAGGQAVVFRVAFGGPGLSIRSPLIPHLTWSLREGKGLYSLPAAVTAWQNVSVGAQHYLN